MEALCLALEKLRDARKVLGSDVALDLPQVVAIGSQSVGKSSVLEFVAGRDLLPVGPKGITKCAIELRLTASASQDDAFEFQGLPYSSAAAAKAALTIAMRKSDFSTSLCLTCSAAHNPNLTLIDLPALSRDTETLALKYISPPGVLILAVIPASDSTLNASSVLRLTKQVDPLGHRTLVVVTKTDLLGKDADLSHLLAKSLPGLQTVAVICRSPTDHAVEVSLAQHKRVEQNFFKVKQKPAVANQHGLTRLLQKIGKYLLSCLVKPVARLKRETELRVHSLKTEQTRYGPAVPVDQEGQAQALYTLLVAYERAFRDVFAGSEEVYNMRIMLHTQLRERLDRCSSLRDIPDETVVTLISNSRGMPGSVFLPRLAMELLVQLECPIFLRESLLCLQQICEEIGTISVNCMHTSALSNFPLLQSAIHREMEPFLKEGEEAACEHITALMEVQEAYLNLQHPSFIGDTAAIRAVTQAIDWENPPSGRVFEARVLKTIAESYSSIMRTQICDQVLKTIVKFVFSPLQEQLFAQLASKLLLRERFSELLQEHGEDKDRRDECLRSLQALQQVSTSLHSLAL